MAKSTVFDLIGPVMVGPSSSHTAGAVRLGMMARKILGSKPTAAQIILHGSFAETGKGHGTNLALIAGILGMTPDDERIPRAFDVAGGEGLDFRFSAGNLGDVHPNTVRILLTGEDEKQLDMVGSSIGGGRIQISSINDFLVEVMGDFHTLVIIHHDLPGAISQVTSLLAAMQINVAQMRVSREKKGARALMIIETDQAIENTVLTILKKIPTVQEAIVIEPLD